MEGRGGSVSRRDRSQAAGNRAQLAWARKSAGTHKPIPSYSSGEGVWGRGASLREAASPPVPFPPPTSPPESLTVPPLPSPVFDRRLGETASCELARGSSRRDLRRDNRQDRLRGEGDAAGCCLDGAPPHGKRPSGADEACAAAINRCAPATHDPPPNPADTAALTLPAPPD